MVEKKDKELIDASLFKRARKAVDEVLGEPSGTTPAFSKHIEAEESAGIGAFKAKVHATKEDIIISVSAMSKFYEGGSGDISVLQDINFIVKKGEMVAVTGPSGCGKSTLLFILGLFLLPTSGEYFFDGMNVLSMKRSDQSEFRRKRVGFVFQSTDLLEKSTVYENLEFPLIYSRIGRRKRKRRIAESLGILNLGHRVRHSANLLSGGEKQRVAVARALVNNPKVILADEPTGQLDRNNSQQIMDNFEKIVEDGKTSVVVVTHDPQVAARCNRVCTLVDGKIYEEL
ncbi:ABC transporter ATP-binding protein [Thermodesulfobacteriota bacterium]